MTFDSSKLYNLFKPNENKNLITGYDVFIGGAFQSVDFAKGAIIVFPLSSKPITSSIKEINENEKMIYEYSHLENFYQIDIYKKNSENITYLEVELEATKIREWLKSYEVMEYLQKYDSGILPAYGSIRYNLNLEINKNFTNKASFDFTILSKVLIKEDPYYVTKAGVNNKILKG